MGNLLSKKVLKCRIFQSTRIFLLLLLLFSLGDIPGFLKWVSLFYCEYLPFDLINFLNDGENTIESAY